MKIQTLALLCFLMIQSTGNAQINQDKTGAWYMYFYNTTFKSGPWGIQGDAQYRSWNSGGDLEQLLLRSGLTFKPRNASIKFTLGYGNITSGTYGESSSTVSEHRIYQEALFPRQFSKRIFTNHRFRFEQRFPEGQDIRTRYRYNLFLNFTINNAGMKKNTLYLALYNELFINGQRNIGNGQNVEFFDRNRFYAALGFVFSKKLKVQAGVMKQSTNSWDKSQVQLSVHHKL